MRIKEFAKIIESAWCRETSAFPNEWTDKNPALGQCFVTALAVYHYFGGEIVEARTMNGFAHYWNRIKGVEIDLTKTQFGKKRPEMKCKSFRSKTEIDSYWIDILKNYPNWERIKDLRRRVDLLMSILKLKISPSR